MPSTFLFSSMLGIVLSAIKSQSPDNIPDNPGRKSTLCRTFNRDIPPVQLLHVSTLVICEVSKNYNFLGRIIRILLFEPICFQAVTDHFTFIYF